MLEFLLKQDIVFALKRFFLFVSLSTFRWNCNCLNLLRRYPFWKDSINFSILSSFICSFSNSFKSKYLNFSFTYSIVKFHVCDFSHCPKSFWLFAWSVPVASPSWDGLASKLYLTRLLPPAGLVGLDFESCSNVPRFIRTCKRLGLLALPCAKTSFWLGRSGWTRTIDLALIRRAL